MYPRPRREVSEHRDPQNMEENPCVSHIQHLVFSACFFPGAWWGPGRHDASWLWMWSGQTQLGNPANHPLSRYFFFFLPQV